MTGRRWRLYWILLAVSLTANGFLAAFVVTTEWLNGRDPGAIRCISQGVLPGLPGEIRAAFLDNLERDRAALSTRAEALLEARLHLLATLAETPSDDAAIAADRQALADGAAGVQAVVVRAFVEAVRKHPEARILRPDDLVARRAALRRCFAEALPEG